MHLPGYLKKQADESVHEYIFFVCLISLALFLPGSRFMQSFTQIILFVSWIADGNFRQKCIMLGQNRQAVFLMLVFPVFVAGMFWTYNALDRLWLSLVDKVPFLTLPLMAATIKPPNKARLHFILWVFVFSVSSTAATGLLLHTIRPEMELRELSPFISHLRYGIMLVMAIFLIIWLTHSSKASHKSKIFSYFVSGVLSVFMLLTGWLTALVSFVSVIGFLLLREAFRKHNTSARRALAGMAMVLSAGLAVWGLVVTARPVFYEPPLPHVQGNELTREGNAYWHDFQNLRRENGNPVYWFIAEDELREAWNQRSTFCFDGKDFRGIENLKSTIFRYMASRGLRKDREGLDALQDYELRAIENGVPNSLHLQWPQFLIRIHQSFWEIQEYRRTGDPEGFSLAQRIELWRAAWKAFSEKPLLGWGTGGVHTAVNFGLDSMESRWEMRDLKPHNQYLLYLITIGTIGFATVAVLIFMFITKSGAYRHLPFMLMMVILLSAMAGEDLLDFQEPTTFFLLFAVIFGILYEKSPIKEKGELS